MNIPPGLVQNPPTDKIRNYETDNNSETDSVAELECKTGEDACAWECQTARVNVPPGLVHNPPKDIMRKCETDDNSSRSWGITLGMTHVHGSVELRC